MQIAPASVGAVRKIISYVSFPVQDPSLDTENTLLALGQDKAVHRGVATASYLFFLFFFFHLSKNFLIFFIYPSKEILRTRFVASFRFVLFLSRQWCGWKFSIAFLQFTEAAIRCVGFGDFQFAGRGGKGIRLDKGFVN